MSKHVEAFKQRHIKPNEQITAFAEGYKGKAMGTGKDAQHLGALIITGERVAFYRKGFLGEIIETIPIRSITSIERQSMLGHKTIRLHTSHDALEFKTFDGTAENQVIEAIEAARG